MPEEQKIEGAFSDLPDEAVKETEPEPQGESKPEPEPQAEPQEDKGKDAALKQERERRKAADKKAKEMEDELKKLKEGPKEEKPLEEVVKEALKQETYEQQSVSAIKAIPGVSRPVAEEVHKLVKTLPQSGDPEADVRAAFAYFQAKSQSQPSMTNPNVGYMSGLSQQKPVPASAKELGKVYGLDDEDWKKHNREITL